MDKAKLLQRQGGTRDVEIPGLGTVTVRALTRAQVKSAKEYPEDEVDLRLITAAIVDPEDVTFEDVAQWLDNAPMGDYVAVMDAIAELSGISAGADKSGVPGVRTRR